MKPSTFLNLFLLAIVAIAFLVCLSNICDDDDSKIDSLFVCDNILQYDQLFMQSLPNGYILLNSELDSDAPKSIILFLSMHEKSPPASIFLITNV